MKSKIINDIIRVEGGYSNNILDSGGETNFGITKAAALAYGYTGQMREMTNDIAFDIYSMKYWDSVRGNDLLSLSEAVAAEVVDTSVNMGPNRAGKFLQRALNALNSRGELYNDLVVDGIIGSGTIYALKCYLSEREEATLVKMLNCLQGAFYVALAEKREKDELFIYGWFAHRVKI